MTEEKYEEKVLKLLATIAEQTKPAQKSAESSEKHEEKKAHETFQELIDCPDCYPKIEALVMPKVKPKIVKEIGEKLKSEELVICKECGEIVGKETEECPTCHGRNYRPI